MYLLAVCLVVRAQDHGSTGRIVTRKIFSKAIENNPAGENPLRQLTIYLPPGYEAGKMHYPVIYFLHGFTRDDKYFISTFHMDKLLDEAIMAKKLRPVIVVFPNSLTIYKGSFYTNSELTGNWADFIANDVVQYIDQNFRTIRDRSSRGLCGHSMGGNGAIKIGMTFSDVFSAIYALSPARLNWGSGLTIGSANYKKVNNAKRPEDVMDDFLCVELMDLARTYSPNVTKSPFYFDLPYDYVGDSVVINGDAWEKWDRNFPINMIQSHLAALNALTALKLDWGRNDEFAFIPIACIEFSKRLEAFGIKHAAEEYVGDHRSGLGGSDGRIYTELIPFFDANLTFGEAQR